MVSKLEIVKQIEYYFGDVNMLWDKHLNDLMDDEGWVLIEEILKFGKLRSSEISKASFMESLTECPSTLVEISSDKLNIRRRLEKEMHDDLEAFKLEKMKRSIYVQKLPKDVALHEIDTFFSFYGPVEDVRMFKKEDNSPPNFIGKAQILFFHEKDAQHLIELQTLIFKGSEIRILKRTSYKHLSQEKCLKIYRRKSGGDNSASLNMVGHDDSLLPQSQDAMTSNYNQGIPITNDSAKNVDKQSTDDFVVKQTSNLPESPIRPSEAKAGEQGNVFALNPASIKHHATTPGLIFGPFESKSGERGSVSAHNDGAIKHIVTPGGLSKDHDTPIINKPLTSPEVSVPPLKAKDSESVKDSPLDATPIKSPEIAVPSKENENVSSINPDLSKKPMQLNYDDYKSNANVSAFETFVLKQLTKVPVTPIRPVSVGVGKHEKVSAFDANSKSQPMEVSASNAESFWKSMKLNRVEDRKNGNVSALEADALKKPIELDTQVEVNGNVSALEADALKKPMELDTHVKVNGNASALDADTQVEVNVDVSALDADALKIPVESDTQVEVNGNVSAQYAESFTEPMELDEEMRDDDSVAILDENPADQPMDMDDGDIKVDEIEADKSTDLYDGEVEISNEFEMDINRCDDEGDPSVTDFPTEDAPDSPETQRKLSLWERILKSIF